MTREPYFDNARFFLILLVVVGHVVAYMRSDLLLLRTLFLWAHLFHMPMFVLISGCFSKPDRSLRYIGHNAQRLLVPYFVFETAALILVSLRDHRLMLDYHLPRNVFWYLVSLFWWRLMLPYAVRIRWIIPLSFAVALLCGYVSFIEWHFSLSRTLVFFPFFLAGYYLRTNLQPTLRRVLPAGAALAILLLAVPLSVMLLPVRSYWFFGATPYAAMGHTEWYSAWYRALVLGCAFVVGFAFLRVVPDEKLSITRPGSRTLYIFLLHDMIVLTALDYLGVFRLFAGGASEILGVLGLSILVTLALSSSLAVRLTRPLVDPVSLFRRRHRSPMPERDPDR